jgi:long-chain acyl-CoA synthetase
MLNLAHFLNVTAKEHPDTLAVILDQRKMTYAEVASAARRVANALTAKGIGKGDKVAMMLANTPHFPIIYYGILHTGATVVPVNVLFTADEIEHYLSDSEAVALFSFTMFQEQAVKAFNRCESCHSLIQCGPADWMDAPEVGENFMHLMMQSSDEFDTVQTMPDDSAVLLYTSGTTGAPKGAELTHFNLFFNAYFAAKEINKVTPGDVCLVTLPLFHSYAQTCLMNACVISGGTMTLVPRFETEKVLEVIQRDKVKLIALVPTMYAFLLNYPDCDKYDLSSIQVAASGGAALPDETHRRFKERFGITIQEGYGLSETSPVASFTLQGMELKVGSIGKPIWGVEMAIMREDGTMAEVDEVGEVVIRGHNIMKGYFNKPEATREAIVNGWFHSGDLGRVDEDGFYFIVDRKKEIIIRGGMNIYPSEIEQALYKHPKIAECAVIGIPDDIRGEEVRYVIAPRAGETITPEEIQSYVEEHLAKYKWPKDIEIMAELPKTATGKILKREIKRMILERG